MDCDRFNQLLASQANADELAQMEAHLDGCDQCTQLLEASFASARVAALRGIWGLADQVVMAEQSRRESGRAAHETALEQPRELGESRRGQRTGMERIAEHLKSAISLTISCILPEGGFGSGRQLSNEYVMGESPVEYAFSASGVLASLGMDAAYQDLRLILVQAGGARLGAVLEPREECIAPSRRIDLVIRILDKDHGRRLNRREIVLVPGYVNRVEPTVAVDLTAEPEEFGGIMEIEVREHAPDDGTK